MPISITLGGIEIGMSTIICVALTSAIVLTWLMREWSWYHYQFATQQTITELSEINENLWIQLQIEEAAQLQCGTDDKSLQTATVDVDGGIETIDNAGTATTLASERFIAATRALYGMPQLSTAGSAGTATLSGIPGGGHTIRSAPVYFDLSGVIQLFLFCALVLLEYHYIHVPITLHRGTAQEVDAERNPEQPVRRELQDFLLRKYPLTQLAVGVTLVVLGIAAWWGLGITNRDAFVATCLKCVISLLLAGPLAYISHNLMRIKQYFPKDSEQWQKSIRDWHWWLWLCSRLIGTYDLRTGTRTLLWLFCLLWYLWPVRYFFYYRFVSCSDADRSVGSGSAVGVGRTGSSSSNSSSETIFLVNMIAQTAFMLVCCYAIYLVSLLKPAAKSQRHVYHKGIGISAVQLGLLGAILEKLDSANGVALLALGSVGNSLLVLIRVLWFCVFSTCTYYACLIAMMVVHVHIGMTIYTLPCVNALMQKYSTILTYKEVFVTQCSEQLLQHQQQPKQSPSPSSADSSSSSSNQTHTAAEGAHADSTCTGTARVRTTAVGSDDVHEAQGETKREAVQADEKQNDEKQEDSNPTTAAAARQLAEDIFNKALTDALLYYIYVSDQKGNRGKKSKTTSEEGGNKENEEEGEDASDDGKLYAIFQAMLQTTAYAYQQQHKEEEEEEEEEVEEEEGEYAASRDGDKGTG